MTRSFFFVLLLAGCATVNQREPIAGWPRLEIVEQHLPHAQMVDRCSRFVSFGMTPTACAEISFETARCHIYYSADFPPQPWIVVHERQHCAGHDHIGSTVLRDALARWRAQ